MTDLAEKERKDELQPLVGKDGNINYVKGYLVRQYINGGDFNFAAGSNVFLQLRDGSVVNVEGDEARRRIKSGQAEWISPVEARYITEEQDYGDSAATAGALGLLDYGTFGAVPWMTRQLSDTAADDWAKTQKHNPGVYHGTGIVGSIASALATMGGSAVPQVAGHSLKVGKGALAASALMGKVGGSAFANKTALGKVATVLAEMNAPALSARMGSLAHAGTAASVGKFTNATLPGLGKSIAEISPFTASLLGGTTGLAAAGLVETGLYSAGEGLSEASLGNLENAGEHIMNTVGSNMWMGAAFSAGLGAAFPILGKAFSGTGRLAGGIYDLTVNTGASRALTDTIAEMGVNLRRGGKATKAEIEDAQLMFYLGKEGQEHRKTRKALSATLEKMADDLGQRVDESFGIEELLQYADRAGVRPERILEIMRGENGQGTTGSVAHTLQKFREWINDTVDHARILSQAEPSDAKILEGFINNWTKPQRTIGMIGQKLPSVDNGFSSILSDLNYDPLIDRMVQSGMDDALVRQTINEIIDTGDIDRLIGILDESMSTGWFDVEFSAKLWKQVERISDEFHGNFGGRLTEFGQTTERTGNVVEKARDFLKDQTVFGLMGSYKAIQDKERKNLSLLWKRFSSEFVADAGLSNKSDPEKILSWLKSLRQVNINSKTKNLSDYNDQSAIVLQNILRDYDLGAIAKRFKFTDDFKRWIETNFGDLIGTTKKDLKINKFLSAQGIQADLSSDIMEDFVELLATRAKSNADELRKDIHFATKEVGPALRWNSVSGQTNNANHFLTGTNSFIPYLINVPMGIAVNIAQGILDPAVGASRLYMMENIVKMGRQQVDNLVDKYTDYIASGGKKRIAPKSMHRAFVLPAAFQRDDPDEVKQQEEERLKARSLRPTFTSSTMSMEQFKDTRDFLSALNSNQALMGEYLDASVSTLGESMPGLRNVLKDLMRKRINHAYENIPKVAQTGMFDEEALPTSIQLGEFSRTLEALNDPVSAISNSMMDGTMTAEVMDAIKIASPLIFDEIRSRTIDIISSPDIGSKLSRQDKMMLSQMFDIPLQSPAVLARLRKSFSAEQEGPGRPPSVKPMKSVTNTGETMTSILERV